MKSSKFNVYRQRGVQTGIFNTLSGRWTLFGAATAAGIRANRLRGLSPATIRRAAAVGALVPDELDEDESYRSCYRRLRDDSGRLAVICVLTYACNLRCPYCFEDGRHEQSAVLEGELVDRVLSAIRRKCEEEETTDLAVMLFGGEPLLRLETCEKILGTLAGWCRRHGRRFTGSMSSNGTLLTGERLARLAPHLDVVQLTFDGPRAIHDTIRIPGSGGGTYDKIVAAGHLLLDHGVSVHVRIQASEQNRDRIPELVRDLDAQGLVGDPRVRFSINVLKRFSRWRCEHTAGAVEPGSELEAELLSTAPDLLPPPLPAVQILPCIMAGNQLCIDPQGLLYKCITRVGRAHDTVGRVSAEGTFAMNDAYHRYMARDPLDFPSCRACAHLPLCGGGCPTAAFTATGSWLNPACSGLEVLNARIDNAMGSKR